MIHVVAGLDLMIDVLIDAWDWSKFPQLHTWINATSRQTSRDHAQSDITQAKDGADKVISALPRWPSARHLALLHNWPLETSKHA